MNELDKIVISNGEISSGQIYGYRENITVKSGGTLDDAYIPSSSGSLTLEAGAILTDSITIGVNTTVQGIVNAGKAALNLDISDRKEESGVLLSDLSYVASKSLTVTVDNNQDKGTYILAGNAADYDCTITIVDDLGSVLGTISLAQPQLDYGMTRYNLAVNSANQLTLTVSSNISDSSDNVFLYKNGILISSYDSIVEGQNAAKTESVDKIYVADGGILSNTTLSSGGTLVLSSGGKVSNLTLQDNSIFDATFEKDDGTELTGKYKDISFSFSNNSGKNLVITENSAFYIKNGVTVDSVYLQNDAILNLQQGATLTGNISGEYYGHINSDNAVISETVSSQSSRWIVANTEIRDSYLLTNSASSFYNCTVSDSTIVWSGGGDTAIEYSELNNVVLDASEYYGISIGAGNILTGTLTIKANGMRYSYSGFIDANGNTVILDLTDKSEKSNAMLDVTKIYNGNISITIKSNQILTII